MSYILINSIMLLNVVVAVLLDEFISSVEREKQKERRIHDHEISKRKITGCQDPLTSELITFVDDEDLQERIDIIWTRLDFDNDGKLGFEEFQVRVMMLVNVSTCFSALACDRGRCPGKYIHLYLKTVDEFQENISELHKAIHVTRDDFDIITDYGKHLGPTAEFDKEQFREMMHGELWRYSRRQLDNVLSLTGDDQFRSTILLVKIFEAQVCKDFAKVFEQLKSISQSVDSLKITNADANRSTCTTPAANRTPEPSAFVPLSAETGGACQQLVAVGAEVGPFHIRQQCVIKSSNLAGGTPCHQRRQPVQFAGWACGQKCFGRRRGSWWTHRRGRRRTQL